MRERDCGAGHLRVGIDGFGLGLFNIDHVQHAIAVVKHDELAVRRPLRADAKARSHAGELADNHLSFLLLSLGIFLLHIFLLVLILFSLILNGLILFRLISLSFLLLSLLFLAFIFYLVTFIFFHLFLCAR